MLPGEIHVIDTESFSVNRFFFEKKSFSSKLFIKELIFEDKWTSKHSYFKLLNTNVFSLELFIVDLKDEGIATLFFV